MIRSKYLFILFLLLGASSLKAQSYNYDSIFYQLPTEKADSLRSLVELTNQFESARNFDSAIIVNQWILVMLPNYAPALTTIAGLYGLEGNYRSEINWANKAIMADSGYLNAYINLGNGYAGLPVADSARKVYFLATFVEPRSPLPWYSLGALEEDRGNYATALSYYKSAIRVDSSFEEGYYNAAMMYANMKDFKHAIETINELLDINPNDADAKDALKHLEADERKKENEK